MKTIIFCTLSLFLFSSTWAQSKYILIEKGWHKEPVYSDTISRDLIRKGYFPININQLDTFLLNVKKFRKLNKLSLKRTYFDNNEFKSENITWEITNIKHPYGDIYDIDITSTTDAGNYRMKLSDPAQTPFFNQLYIKQLIEYIELAKKGKKQTLLGQN